MAEIWTTQEKTGSGWLYDQNRITYNGFIDPENNNEIFYNKEGNANSWTNQIKN